MKMGLSKGNGVMWEEEADDWCFFCKDGGDLIICDHKGCLKVYHSYCAGKDATSRKHWKCARHTCFVCHKSAKIYCFCCPNAVCGRCDSAAEFYEVRGDGGFCDDCVKLILLIEENAEYDSDGESLDFEDRDTRECLFKEYWEIVKEREGLSLDHVLSSDTRLKKAKSKISSRGCGSPIVISVSEGTDGSAHEVAEDKEVKKPRDKQTYKSASECDGRDKVKKPKGKETYESGSDSDGHEKVKKSKGKLVFESGSESDDRVKVKRLTVKEKTSSGKFPEFEGWGSKPLICFLKSIGEDTTKKLSRSDVDFIINNYIEENNLFHPGRGKKKKVHCDDKLYAIFKKKNLNRHMIYHLLEQHFMQKEMHSGEDEMDCRRKNLAVEEDKIKVTARKKQKSTDYESKFEEKEVIQKIAEVPKGPDILESCFAALNADNLKLVYLKRSFVEALLKQSETAEGKIVGSFIKVKGDLTNHISKSSHQLLQVTGLKQGSTANADLEILLEVYGLSNPVSVKMLSDADLSEEECEVLQERVENGFAKKLTVIELQEKATALHEDITKLSIEKELVLLQHLIDQANEKGWRRETKDEYLGRKAILKTSIEQERRLNRVPKVVPEKRKLKPSASPPHSDDKEETADFLNSTVIVEGNPIPPAVQPSAPDQ